MRSLFRFVLTSLLALVFFTAAAVAQESPAKKKAVADQAKTDAKKPRADPTKARAEFDGVYADWKTLMANLAELQGQYQKAAEQDRPAIEKEYQREAARGAKLAEKLKAATLAAFAADPGAKDVSQLLTAMVLGAWHEDNHEEALRLARIVLDERPADQQIAEIAASSAFALHEFDQVEPILQKASGQRQVSTKMQELLNDAREYPQLWQREQKIRQTEAEADDLPRVKLQTTKGDITIELFENEAPNTVASFVSLVEKGYYDNAPFHRVLPHFMAQGGDPTGSGNGGPGYRIKDELDPAKARMHFRGSLSMANSGQPHTNGSQFFITFRPTPHLNSRHTVFGRAIDGLEVLSKIQRIDPEKPSGVEPDRIVKATVLRKRDHEYKPETIRE